MTKCEEVIVSDQLCRGNGMVGSPYRTVMQVFNKSGKLIAEKDPCGGYTEEDLVAFVTVLKNTANADPLQVLQEWVNKRSCRQPIHPHISAPIYKQ